VQTILTELRAAIASDKYAVLTADADQACTEAEARKSYISALESLGWLS
jgi:hypothetical protein